MRHRLGMDYDSLPEEVRRLIESEGEEVVESCDGLVHHFCLTIEAERFAEKVIASHKWEELLDLSVVLKNAAQYVLRAHRKGKHRHEPAKGGDSAEEAREEEATEAEAGDADVLT